MSHGPYIMSHDLGYESWVMTRQEGDNNKEYSIIRSEPTPNFFFLSFSFFHPSSWETAVAAVFDAENPVTWRGVDLLS